MRLEELRLFTVTPPPVREEEDGNECFDAISEESQFDIRNAVLEEPSAELQFSDSLDADPTLFASSCFALDDFIPTVHHVYGAAREIDLAPLEECLPTPMAYNAGLMGRVDLYPPDPDDKPFKVIFDSGASLAITPYRGDFIRHIKPFPIEHRLGGMANGMLIEGIG